MSRRGAGRYREPIDWEGVVLVVVFLTVVFGIIAAVVISALHTEYVVVEVHRP